MLPTLLDHFDAIRVISLPEDSDPERVEARYTDGCLRVSIRKRESSRPRSIQIQ